VIDEKVLVDRNQPHAMGAYRLTKDASLLGQTGRMIAGNPDQKDVFAEAERPHEELSRQSTHNAQDCGFHQKPRFTLLHQLDLQK
jgi:hypothetical protein